MSDSPGASPLQRAGGWAEVAATPGGRGDLDGPGGQTALIAPYKMATTQASINTAAGHRDKSTSTAPEGTVCDPDIAHRENGSRVTPGHG